MNKAVYLLCHHESSSKRGRKAESFLLVVYNSWSLSEQKYAGNHIDARIELHLWWNCFSPAPLVVLALPWASSWKGSSCNLNTDINSCSFLVIASHHWDQRACHQWLWNQVVSATFLIWCLSHCICLPIYATTLVVWRINSKISGFPPKPLCRVVHQYPLGSLRDFILGEYVGSNCCMHTRGRVYFEHSFWNTWLLYCVRPVLYNKIRIYDVSRYQYKYSYHTSSPRMHSGLWMRWSHSSHVLTVIPKLIHVSSCLVCCTSCLSLYFTNSSILSLGHNDKSCKSVDINVARFFVQ